jgi:hypothetical protein
MVEINEKEARDKIAAILNAFDRRAVREQMHEENIFFMLRSLRELRVAVQRLGSSTVDEPIMRFILNDLREELEALEEITQKIIELRPGDDWAESFLDYRIFGSAMPAESDDHGPGNVYLQDQLDEAERFCTKRVFQLH